MFDGVQLTAGAQQRLFLFRQLIQRDIERRYRATVGGMAWAVLQPLIMIGIYTVVFGLIFKPRWPAVENTWDYVLILFLGKIPYILVTEAFAQSANVIHGHVNLVKRAVFPLHMLPGVALGSSIYHAMIAMLVWIVFFLLIRHDVPWNLVAVPLLWTPMVLFTLGLGWVIAAFGAYFRDTGQVVGSINMALMFVSPIFYPSDSVPGSMRLLMTLNPLAFAIESARDVVLFGAGIDWSTLGVQMVAGMAFAWFGFAFFRRMRPGFADSI